jgi:hypothetical protein
MSGNATRSTVFSALAPVAVELGASSALDELLHRPRSGIPPRGIVVDGGIDEVGEDLASLRVVSGKAPNTIHALELLRVLAVEFLEVVYARSGCHG